jgi:putative ABC transport system permease protein
MIKHYFKVLFRTALKSKLYTSVNITGLSTGMVVFILIMLYVNYEYSVDAYHENKDRIYRIAKQEEGNMYMGDDRFAVTMAPLGPAVKAEIPEVEQSSRIARGWNPLIRAGDETHLERGIYGIDPDAFKIFTFEYVSGNPDSFLKEKYTAVITESVAKRYYQDQEPVGQTLQYEDKEQFKVVGVIKDMPVNSHFRMDIMIPFETLLEITNSARNLQEWGNSSYYTYILLHEDADPSAMEAKLATLAEKYIVDKDDPNDTPTRLFLQPFPKIHLHSDIHFDIGATVDIKQLYIYETIAILILFIACINYMNLASARATLRAKEVGIRKVAGAQRRDLILQFLGESLLITFCSLAISLVATVLIIPYFEQFTELNLSINLLHHPRLLIMLIGLCLAVGLFSGSYPAFMLSSFRPMAVLKGRYIKGAGGTGLRHSLVVVQFAISGCLIISSLIITRQLQYIQNKDMGYQREHIVTFRLMDKDLINKMPVLKEALLKIPGVLQVASSTNLPNSISSNTGVKWPGKPDDVEWSIYQGSIDASFISLYDMEIVEGRNFSPALDKSGRAVLINESAARELPWDNPVGQELINWKDTARIVGVMKDFHQHSLHLPIMPLQLFYRDSEWYVYVSIRITGDNIPQTLDKIQAVKESFSDTYPFTYAFFDDEFNHAYKKEQKTGKAVGWFTVITIIIACLGLYGLATFTAEQRIREVGIRRVLGARIMPLVFMLSRDFTYPVVISFVVAVPAAYFFMDRWLSDFAFHVPINPTAFVTTLIGMVIVACLTVGYRTFKVARSNPVDSLKEE